MVLSFTWISHSATSNINVEFSGNCNSKVLASFVIPSETEESLSFSLMSGLLFISHNSVSKGISMG